MRAILADVRYAMRSARRRPLLFVVSATVLALAIGATARALREE